MAFCSPREIVQQLKLRKGSHVADFGAGVGNYIGSLLQAVGEEGRVYAIDLNNELLSSIKREASSMNWDNLEVLRGDLEDERGSGLRDESIDTVIIANVLFQIEDKDTFIGEVARVLKVGGQAACVDWKDSFEGTGPAKNYVVTREEAEELFNKHGLKFIRELSAGDCHYGLVFQK